jgi:uncharacterized membrane protein HdeD (DUF308 family)
MGGNMAENFKAKKPEETEAAGLHSYEVQGPWWVILIAGIATLAFGFIILGWPLMSLAFLVVFFGILAIIFGIAAVIRSFTLIKREKTWWVLLIEGMLGIAIGIFIFIWPIATTIFIIYFIAAWLIITGMSAIVSGSSAKSSIGIFSGVISLMLGIFIFLRPPFYATATLLLFIGFFAIFRGIAMIVESIAIKAAASRAAKEATAKEVVNGGTSAK